MSIPYACPINGRTYHRNRYSKKRVHAWLVGILIILQFTHLASTAQNTPDLSVQANIIYHFTKYIDWPENRKNGSFIIGVVGESPVYDELKKMMRSKMVGNQPIVVRHLSMSEVSTDYHILFISEDESANLKKIAGKTAANPVLLVSEEEGLASLGACINFIIVQDRLKLEINKNNILLRQLNIASELLQLGKIVK